MLVVVSSRVIRFIILSLVVTTTCSATYAADVANTTQNVVGRPVGPVTVTTVRCIAVGVVGLMWIIGNAVLIAASTIYPGKSEW